MNKNWLEYKDFPNIYDEKKLKQLDGILVQLKKIYGSGEAWLKTPTTEKEMILYKNATDSSYLLMWACERNLFSDPDSLIALKEYFFRNGPKFALTFVDYALHYGYLSVEEADFIESFRKKSVGRSCKAIAAILCIFYSKSFKELTDEELDSEHISWVYELYKLGRRSPRMLLQQIRIHYGLTQKVINQKKYKKWLDKMSEQYPMYSTVFKQYSFYMKSIGYSASTISSHEIGIKKLFAFIDEQDDISLANFNGNAYIHFFNWLIEEGRGLEGALNIIYQIKKFILWGISDFELFPRLIDYPESFFKGKSKEVTNARAEGNGRAFPIEGLAENIVKKCYEYTPLNEIESLCKDFWLIASSCPVRFNFIRNLSNDCMYPLMNSKELYGLTSTYEDKGGNVNGEFPILDKLGVKTVLKLQDRVKNKGFKPIINPSNKQSYIHLFQLDEYPYLVPEDWIRDFLQEKILPQISEVKKYEKETDSKIQVGAHGFRHFIATKVQAETRDIRATQFVLGHHNTDMTMQYLRSKISKNTLLYSIVDGYEKKELSGKFYLRLLDLLTDDKLVDNDIFETMNKQMELNTFLKQFGKKRDMGWCMAQENCETYYRCWGCQHFILRKEEIEEAVEKLAKHAMNHQSLIKNSENFSYDNPVAADSIKKIALIQKRIMDLGVSAEKVWEMVKNRIQGQDIKEVFKNV